MSSNIIRNIIDDGIKFNMELLVYFALILNFLKPIVIMQERCKKDYVRKIM